MDYWWVNQNQTYAHEVRGGYLWSPKTNANGGRNQFYDFMRDVRPGDVIFSFCDTYIKAIGVAVGVAESAPKPTAFGSAGAYWNNEGWFLEVEFRELATSMRPREHMQLLEPTLPGRYSPIRATGEGNQGAYLAKVPVNMAATLLRLIGAEADLVIDALGAFGREHAEELAAEAQIKDRNDIPSTEVAQLIKARRGQGLYKSRVELIENGCRVTGLRRPEHLVASHIKPWRLSSDAEKLDGNNGLLLSPHIDHLFDRSYISFSNHGRILVSSILTPEVLAKWSIDRDRNVGAFSRDQQIYLDYHRDELFAKRQVHSAG
ncbi:MAG: HNH endonuclease [Casimicrobiaceae bacterium]